MKLSEILAKPYGELDDEEKQFLFSKWDRLSGEAQSAYRSGLPEQERREFDFDLYSYNLER